MLVPPGRSTFINIGFDPQAEHKQMGFALPWLSLTRLSTASWGLLLSVLLVKLIAAIGFTSPFSTA